MEDDNKLVGGSTSAAEIIDKVTQLQKSYEGQVLQLQGQVRNLQQYIKDLEETHVAELTKYAVKSDVDPETEELRITDPLKIPEVMEMILKNLEVDSLRAVRSVCKLWNETWIRIISKQPFCVELHGDSISKLHSLLSKSSAPEAIIQKINCYASYGDYSKSEEKLQELLKTFGQKIKILGISHEESVFSPLKFFLVDSGEWCQNLEELNIHVDAKADNFQEFILKEDQLSRLKRLKFHSVCTDDDDDESRVPGDKHLFVTLIKASPNLECLIMGLPPDSDSDFKNMKVVAECVNSLNAYPEVTRNLKEFQIGGNWSPEFNLFKNLLEVEFSSKLKTLTLDCDFDPVMPKKAIAELLKKLGGSLESLTIWGGQRSDVNTEGFDWPILPRLKILKNYAQDQFELELGELKSKMPILETLILAGNSHNYLIDKRCLSKLFDIEGTQRMFHHLTLKDMEIFGKIYSAKTAAMVNRMFPYVSKLAIYMYPHKSDIKGPPRWFKEAFEGLSQMHKITHLTLCLRNYCFENYDLCTDFEKLQNLPHLRFLTLISDSKVPVDNSFAIIVIELLSKCQGLKRLKLINFTAPISIVEQFMEERSPDTQLKFADEHRFLNDFL